MSASYSAPAIPPEPGGVVIQLARLGDFLQTTPLLAALKARRPHQPLTALVAPAQAPLALRCGYLDNVVCLDLDLMAALAAESASPEPVRRARLTGMLAPVWEAPASRVFNLNLGMAGALIAGGFANAEPRGWRLSPDGKGLSGEPWSRFVMATVADRRLTRMHLTDILASYAEPAGPPLAGLDYRVQDEDRGEAAALLSDCPGPLVALQLGANNDLRRWPVDSFAALGRGLLAQGCRLVLVGTARERVLGRRLVRELGSDEGVCDLMGRTDLPALGAVLAKAELVVSADTGTLHLACAVGSRVLALYMGPAQAHETGPYGAGHLVLQARDHCGPCQEDRPACGGEAPCRRIIDPWNALKAALALLGGADARRAAAGLDPPEGLHPLCGVMDGFGQRYRPLRPQPLNRLAALGIALREAGRTLLRPAYRSPATALAEELRGEHLPPEPGEAAAIVALARDAASLTSSIRLGDLADAARIAAEHPGLAPLTAGAGPGAPERLGAACRAAAQALELAAAQTGPRPQLRAMALGGAR